MDVEVTVGDPHAVGADLVAAAGAQASQLGAPDRAVADADPVATVYTTTPPLAVVALEPGVDGLRTAAARSVRACRGGGTVAWALDASLPVPIEDQVRALAEGAVIGSYDGRRWRSGEPPRARRALRDLRCRRAARARGRTRRARRTLDQRRPRARRRAAQRHVPGRARRTGSRAPGRERRDDRRRGRGARRPRRRRREQPDRAAPHRAPPPSRPARPMHRGSRSWARPSPSTRAATS